MTILEMNIKSMIIGGMARQFGVILKEDDLEVATREDSVTSAAGAGNRSAAARCIYEVYTISGSATVRVRAYCTSGPMTDMSKIKIDRNSSNNPNGEVLYTVNLVLDQTVNGNIGGRCPRLGPLPTIASPALECTIASRTTGVVYAHGTGIVGAVLTINWQSGMVGTTIVDAMGMWSMVSPDAQTDGDFTVTQVLMYSSVPMLHAYTEPPVDTDLSHVYYSTNPTVCPLTGTYENVPLPAPSPPVISTTAFEVPTNLNTVTGTAPANMTVEVTWPNAEVGVATVDANGDWSIESLGRVPVGTVVAKTIDPTTTLESTDVTANVTPSTPDIHLFVKGGTTATVRLVQDVAMSVMESNGTITPYAAQASTRDIVVPSDNSGTHIWSTGTYAAVPLSEVSLIAGDYTDVNIYQAWVDETDGWTPSGHVVTNVVMPEAGLTYPLVSRPGAYAEVAANTVLGPLPVPQGGAKYTMNNAFSGNGDITQIPSWDFTLIGAMYRMFNNCSALTSVPDLVLHNSDSAVCREMFGECTSIVTVGNITRTNDGFGWRGMFDECTSMTTVGDFAAADSEGHEFQNCNVLANIGTVTCNNGSSGEFMFQNCGALTVTPAITWTISGAESMYSGCSSLTSMGSHVITNGGSTRGMFWGCTNMTSVGDITGETSSTRDMFRDCTSLVCISSLDSSQVVAGATNAGDMFTNAAAVVNPTGAEQTSLAGTPGIAYVNGTSCP